MASAPGSSFPEKFHPTSKFRFPKRKFGKGQDERSFRIEWCEKYPWIHYDATVDAAFWDT